MAIDRRALLAGFGAALAAPGRAVAAEGREAFVAACKEPSGAFAALVCDLERGVVARVPLPDRGHDIAVRPDGRVCVAFARRPGRFAVAFAPDGSSAPVSFEATPGRHFFGHGAFSRDGRLLYSTEDDVAQGHGVIGVRDATGGYRRIGEFRSGGAGPHDIRMLRDGRTLAVANGGYQTAGGRLPIDRETMAPSLCYVDAATGDLLERQALPRELHKLSIRHLAEGADGALVFGCQDEGTGDAMAPLIGFHRRGGAMRLIEAAPPALASLKGYVGSVEADGAGAFAVATSPRGGVALVIDIARRSVVRDIRLADVCGVAAGHRGAGFILTSGFGRTARATPEADGLRPLRQDDVAWDAHAATVVRI